MDRIRLDVTLPRGPEHYWTTMCELTRVSGGFTITEIWKCTNGRSRGTIKTYVGYCLKHGDISDVSRPDCKGRHASVKYRVVNLNACAPIHRRDDYTGERGRIQQQIWSTMRGLDQFTIRELAVEASTDEVPVREGAAKDYVAALLAAGYLLVVRPSEKLKARGVFRLRPAMNTGPKPPAIMKARFVFDRNRAEAVAIADAEALS